ncbi:acyltransferase [Aliarcobacter butzleri]|uniref:acyltransferase n=1 Tax=Aliarcobacter butzleri TaxID=28197 RepID=UPI003B227489
MKWFFNELKTIYQIDILRFRSKLFLFLFNIVPEFYILRIFKNLLLKLSGVNLSLLFVYIKNGLYFDNAKSLYLGKGIFINCNVSFEGLGNVSIGDSVKIGPNVQFLTTNHKDKTKDEIFDIRIGNNVWIGAGCIILPGSEIGDNVNIAAGSIVKGKILDGNLWAGNPAVRKR